MLDDEIESVSRFNEVDEDESEHAKELSVDDEAATDNMIDELVDMAHAQNANLNVSTAKETDSHPPSVQVPRHIMVINAKHFQTKVEKNAFDLHEFVGFESQLVRLVDSVAPPNSAATEGEKGSQAQAHPQSQSEFEPTMEDPASS
ncbi:hypothetical protein Tco_0360700 [Tanacetum coccineum]